MPDEKEIKIGIWGGSGSGKTTFLSALEIATLSDQTGTWNIWADEEASPGSATFLLNGTESLMSKAFPEPTNSRSTLTYAINGDLTAGLINKLMVSVGRPRHISFRLHVFDYPGEDLLLRDPEDEIWGNLSACDGLVYLYDPHQRDVRAGNFKILSRSMMMMHQFLSRTNKNMIQNGLLPQHLAVCLTQFDDDEIFTRLRKEHLITQERNAEGIPYVTDADKAFGCFAESLTRQRIERTFHRGRIRFFVTSSIGFYRENGRVDIDRCSNVSRELGGTKLRGEPMPIGVLEPLVWIHSQLV